MSSMDEVSPSMDDIHVQHFHPWMRLAHFTNFEAILAKIGNLCEQNVNDENSIHG